MFFFFKLKLLYIIIFFKIIFFKEQQLGSSIFVWEESKIWRFWASVSMWNLPCEMWRCQWWAIVSRRLCEEFACTCRGSWCFVKCFAGGRNNWKRESGLPYLAVPPWKLPWNLKITQLKRKIIFRFFRCTSWTSFVWQHDIFTTRTMTLRCLVMFSRA